VNLALICILLAGFIATAYYVRRKINALSSTQEHLFTTLNQKITELTTLQLLPKTVVAPFFNDTSLSLDAAYGQTVSEQQYLLTALEAIHCKNELNFLNFFHHSSQLISDNQQTTLFSTLPTHAIAKRSNVTLINPRVDQKISLTTFEKNLTRTEQVCLTNPFLALMLLLNPNTLERLSHFIQDTLSFPYVLPIRPLSIEWDSTFSDTEQDNDLCWRWALGPPKVHSLFITNNKMNTQTLALDMHIWCPDYLPIKLTAYFLQETYALPITHDKKIILNLAVPPGRHRLTFVYDGHSILPDLDSRLLNFGIVNLHILSTADEIILSGQEAYANQEHTFTPYLDDTTIRHQLHDKGFFEVQAFATSALHNKQRRLATSRFSEKNGYYIYETEEPASDLFSPDVIWYKAKRGATLKEEPSHA
jgi:hypothetical protein